MFLQCTSYNYNLHVLWFLFIFNLDNKRWEANTKLSLYYDLTQTSETDYCLFKSNLFSCSCKIKGF